MSFYIIDALWYNIYLEKASHFINGHNFWLRQKPGYARPHLSLRLIVGGSFPVTDVEVSLKYDKPKLKGGVTMSIMDYITISSLLVGVFALGYMFGSKK